MREVGNDRAIVSVAGGLCTRAVERCECEVR
jgi:hypothetical protein